MDTLISSRAASTPQALVLIVDDEPGIVDVLNTYLLHSGLRTACAVDGRQALDYHLSLKPDLVLLDVNMPHIDGWKVLAEIRNRGDTPVIMLTAFDQDVDKLTGLRIGADDYIVKPFNPAEVIARTEAVLRRSYSRAVAKDSQILRAAPFEIDLDNHEVTVFVEGRQHTLIVTLTEFNLLVHLARSPKRVSSRAELLSVCLPEGDSLERTVDSHISKLRRKLEMIGITDIPVGVRGVGYKLWSKE
jgi:two-component system response regulator AdeR